MRKLGRLFVLIALLFCLPVSPASAQDDSIDKIKLIDIDAASFPDVSVSFQAVDGEGVPLELRGSDISVYEDGDEVSVSLRDEESVPTNVLFLVDLGGLYSNLSSVEWNAPDVLRDALTQFVDEQFNEGVDTLSLYTTRERGTGLLTPILEESTSGSAFVNAVNSLNFENVPNGESYFAMGTAAGTLSNFPNTEQANLAIVYIGDMHTTGQGVGAQTLLDSELSNFIEDQLLPNNIRFYALHTTTGDQTFTPHLQLLANATGGAYVELSQQVGNDVRVNNLYDELGSYGDAYKATFRSESGTDEQREVVIVPFGDRPSTAESELRYEVNLQPPTINVDVPDNVERTQRPNGTYDKDLIQLSVKVIDWPDGFEREISRVQLFIDGQRQPSNNRPTGDVIEIPFDLSPYEGEGETNISLRVEVEDELGIEEEVTKNMIVTVVRSDVQITSTPGGTSSPPPPPPPTATPPFPIGCVLDCDPRPTIAEILITLLPVIISFIALGLVGLIFFRYRKQEGGVSGAVSRGVRAISQTILGGAGARRQQELAKVKIVTAREDLRGQEVSIYEHVTRFGRNPQICDIQLFDEDDKSSVSGQHCTLQYDPGQQCFFLTDDNSSVGTYINDNPIAPNDPIRLQVGDEIVLGELVRRGAKLKLLSIANDLPPTQFDGIGVGDDGLLGTIYEDDLPALFGNDQGRDPSLSDAFSPKSPPAPSTVPLNPTGSGSNVVKKKPKKLSDSRQTILETTVDSDQIHVPDTTTQIYQQEEESADWMEDLE